jgi:FAD/FMN-containing dehydrogenase
VQLTTMPYWEMQATFASREAERHGFGDLSRFSTRPLPDAIYARIADLLADCPVRTTAANGSMWSLGWVGGPVVGRIARRATAYVHRDVLTLLRATPVWPIGARAERDELLAWTDDMIALITPHTPDASYQNFPNRRIEDWERQYYGENYRRLMRVKARWDPHELFRNRQSVRPLRPRR